MSEVIGVRALHRSQRVRIGTSQLKTNITNFVNLSNGRTRLDLNRHSALGAFATVLPLTTLADVGKNQRGGAVTQSLPASLTVNIAAGVTVINGSTVNYSATTKTATAADATYPRYDIITVSAAGAVVLTAGTAAASPVLPTVPVTSQILAILNVTPGATVLTKDNISDVR